MKDIGIILASHGLFSKEAYETVGMITGNKPENCEVVSVLPGESYDDAILKMNSQISKLNRTKGVLILTDIYGGTPANVATQVAIEDESVLVYAGFNLPMLLEIVLQESDSIEVLKNKIDEFKDRTIEDVTEILRRVEEDGDQMDSY